MLSSADIKRALREAGFEIYRTGANEVYLAERVRENLIMDAGISVHANAPRVLFHARAQQSHFPGEDGDALFERASRLGAAACVRGWREAARFVTQVTDPGDPSRTLDHFYEVQFEKAYADLDGALAEVRFAFAQVKTAQR